MSHQSRGGNPTDADGPSRVSRRDLLKTSTAAASGAGLLPTFSTDAEAADGGDGNKGRLHNIILIISDQESYRLLAPDDYDLPVRAELDRRGTRFENHYVGAAMCTASRGVMFSGQPPQVNGLFDQMELGYVPSMKTDKPSMGTVMRELGYKTAYFGKFELKKSIIFPTDTTNYTAALDEYGFDTFSPDGDKTGAQDQGYDTDIDTAADAVRWMRTHGQALNAAGHPWFLVVSFIMPHDVMYTDANLPGDNTQASEVGLTITPPPDNAIYRTEWTFPLSPTHSESLGAPGRPRAQREYYIGWSNIMGYIPNSNEAMWHRFYNFYLNLLRDNDQNIGTVIDAVTELGLWENTVVVRTADHGELGGSHGGLRGKGPFPYEEHSHVPLVIVHPDQPGGRQCHAVTSHVDLVPTLAGLTGASEEARRTSLGGLPGYDFTGLLATPETAGFDAIRPAVLFSYVGLQTIDARYLLLAGADTMATRKGLPPLSEVHPDLSKQGFINFCFDGRYKFARYYAPAQFNTPIVFDEIYEKNELELFDLESDPNETDNLAIKADDNRALILAKNELLNDLIADEVGVNNGSFLPDAVRPEP
ncbi:MAG: sulfatase-like hydrolase/transferase [Pseudomonadota bacterium]